MRQAVFDAHYGCEGSETLTPDSARCGALEPNESAYNKYFDWRATPGIEFWSYVVNEAYGQHSIAVWVWRQDGNRFFLNQVFLFKLRIPFLKFFDLFGSKDFAVINFNSGVLFYPFVEGGLGNNVFIAKLYLVFTIMV